MRTYTAPQACGKREREKKGIIFLKNVQNIGGKNPTNNQRTNDRKNIRQDCSDYRERCTKVVVHSTECHARLQRYHETPRLVSRTRWHGDQETHAGDYTINIVEMEWKKCVDNGVYLPNSMWKVKLFEFARGGNSLLLCFMIKNVFFFWMFPNSLNNLYTTHLCCRKYLYWLWHPPSTRQ